MELSTFLEDLPLISLIRETEIDRYIYQIFNLFILIKLFRDPNKSTHTKKELIFQNYVNNTIQLFLFDYLKYH